MFVNKYFVLMFITLYDSIKSSNGQFPTIQYFNRRIENEKFDLQHPFGNETNFLIKAKLNYEAIEGSANDFYIEESIFSDERNRIVTLISHEANPIEIFRQFETQRIELVCFPLKHCYRDGDLRNYQFHSEHEMVIRIVKSALLMGPYRIISFFANETNNKISRWIDTGNGSTQYMEMTAVFSDRHNKKLMGLKNALKITITEGQDGNVTLYITQVEPFKKITIEKLDGGRTSQLTESIGSRKNLFTITSVDSVSTIKISDGKLNDRELVYDYKSGMKYTLSGSNECAIEFGDAPDKLILVDPDYYGGESYFPKNPVALYSNKFMVKAEYNKVIDNVSYDLVVTTYSLPSPNKPILSIYSSQWFADLSIEQKLYSKSATNEESFQYDYIESRVISFSRVTWHFDRYLNEIVNLNDRCFRERKEAIILNLKISLLDQSTSRELHTVLASIDEIKKYLRRLIMDKLGISILRINLIKFNFFHSHIMAKVEIFDSIVINFLSKRGVSHKFNIKSTESGQIHTSTIDECLHLKASKANLSDVITCKTGDYLCLGIAHGDSLPDENENGLDCMVFSNSDQRLSRLSAEVPLKVIEKSYLNLNGSQLSAYGFDLVVVDITIGDGMRLDSPKKTKSNSTFAFLFIFSILINILIFVKFALDYKLSRRRTRPLKDTVSIKLDNLNN
ncbi:uncharacterized protein LOC107370484 [Tetranychus urticae]|uniref:uncharacterized protein LOC107370484 n=1 Tax=Tetranychus urticae TaxID=32264 RepID=UPI00077BCEF8|nr:uncharacterized protein LOC107370484 [Tetranychus urticae]